MQRKLELPVRHQLAVATVIDFILAHAEGTPPQTDKQREVIARLTQLDPDRRISRKLAQNFKNISAKNKARGFGLFDPGKFRVARIAESGALAANPTMTVPMFDDVGPVIIPTFPDGTEFAIHYTGLYCRDNSGDRGIFGRSDETYVITAAVSIENGQNVIRDEMHPIGVPSKHYDDVDDGESRIGPIAAVWNGPEPTAEISLVTVVMEHDEGDPDFYRDEIATIVGGAVATAAVLGLIIPAAIIAVIGLTINWLVDSDDDVLGTGVTIISPSNMKNVSTHPTRELVKDREVLVPLQFGAFQVQTVTDETGLQHHFAEHIDDDAEYFVTYKYTADQEPIDPPQGGFEQPVFVNPTGGVFIGG